MTAVALPPAALIPGLKIDPSALMNALHGFAEPAVVVQPLGGLGSQFGTIIGFTQRG
jgi:hypothetical protein